jgi:hypothetical protein
VLLESSAEQRATYEAGRDKSEQQETHRKAMAAKGARRELERLEQEHAQLERHRRQLEVESSPLGARSLFGFLRFEELL